MRRNGIFGVAALAAALACFAAEAQAQPKSLPYPAPVAERLKAARDAQAAGDFTSAEQAYEGAREASASAGAEGRAQVSLMHAQGIERWVAADASQAARLSAAETLYRQVIANGTPVQQRLARNNLGTLLLRRKQPAEALQVLQGIDLAAEPDKRFAYEYNLGRAFEQTAHPDDAFKHYLASIGAQPTFAPAREAAIGLLKAQTPVGAKAKALCDALVANGQPAPAADVARALLPKATGADGPVLLDLLLRAYVSMSIDLASFQNREIPFLSSLAVDRIRQQSRDVVRAMADDKLPVVPDPHVGRQLFQGWAYQEETRAFAAFVKYAGDLYSPTSAEQALARYVAAWHFDHSNGESAVYAAMTVRDHPEVDRDHRVLDLLIQNIFEDKMAYIRGEDWPNSLRMHLVLGNIFEQLGKWGPETDSHTAAFQFRAAIQDEERIRTKDKNFSQSPGLYSKLGQAYMRLDKPALAKEQFTRAATAFEQTGRLQEAAAVREQMRMVSPP